MCVLEYSSPFPPIFWRGSQMRKILSEYLFQKKTKKVKSEVQPSLQKTGLTHMGIFLRGRFRKAKRVGNIKNKQNEKIIETFLLLFIGGALFASCNSAGSTKTEASADTTAIKVVAEQVKLLFRFGENISALRLHF